MIKIEHVVLPSPEQMEFVIEGMRNPMNSWDKSDSRWYPDLPADDDDAEFVVGPNDRKLMQALSNAGNSDRKFMRMMPVMVRITAPLYWWKEFDTYKVGTVANSCSTMHKITEKEFTLDDFSIEKLTIDSVAIINDTISALNSARDYYINYDKYSDLPDKKDIWWQLIQLLPSSYNQTRNVMLNYEVLKNMHDTRRNHKLDEWREFCKWIESLPYATLITGEED